MTSHANAPPELREDLRVIVDRNISGIAQTLAGIVVSEPAFALCLWASDEPELYAAYISIGLESDRRAILGRATPWEAAVEVWESGNYSHDGLEVPDPRSEEAFVDAETRVNRWLADAEISDPSRWMMEEVALRLTRDPPAIPVTEDFVTYAFAQGEPLTASLRWIAPPETQRTLEQKRLLVDDLDSLPGAPDYDAELDA